MTILEKIEEAGNVYYSANDSGDLEKIMKEFEMDDANWKDFIDLIVNTCDKSEFLFCSVVSDFGNMLIGNFERDRRYENTGLMAGRFEIMISEGNDTLPTLVKLWEPESDMVNLIVLR
jgi:hypothetical protein